MNDKIDELAQDMLFTIERRGLEPAMLIAALQQQAAVRQGESPTSASAGGVSLAEYGPQALRTLGGRLTQTQRTYKTGFNLLINGIVMHWAVPSAAPKPWADDEVDAWLAHAHAINTDRNFGLEIPSSAAACSRTYEGAAIVWAGFGHVPVARLTMSQVIEGGQWARLRSLTTDAVRRAKQPQRPRKHFGDGAYRTYIAAVRYLYRVAQGDGVVPLGHSPAAQVSLKGTAPGTRQPITGEHVCQAQYVFCETGDDPELDSWIYYYHLETGSRQEAGFGLKRLHIDVSRGLIYPPDKTSKAKAGQLREEDAIPARDELIAGLLAFATSRGSTDPEDFVLLSKRRDPTSGRHVPITRRRYNTIYKRMRKHTDWAEERNFGVHHLRGFVAGRIEDNFGRRYKMRYLRHEPNGQTDRYGRASLDELAAILPSWFIDPAWPDTSDPHESP